MEDFVKTSKHKLANKEKKSQPKKSIKIEKQIFNEVSDVHTKAIKTESNNVTKWIDWAKFFECYANIEMDTKKKKSLIAMACDCFAEATEFEPNNSTLWLNWSNLLKIQAHIEDNEDEKQHLLDSANTYYIIFSKLDKTT